MMALQTDSRTIRPRRCGAVAAALVAVLIVGCGKKDDPAPASSNSAGDRSPGATTDQTSTSKAPLTKVKIKTGVGEPIYELKPKDDGAKLVDVGEQELARYNASPGKLKTKDPGDVVLGYIVGSGGKFKVEDESQEVEWFKLQRQDDGDWKLEDPQDKLIYKIKVREYGYEIEDDAENSLYKIKLKDGRTSLRNAADETVFYTNDPVSTLGFACLGFDVIDDIRIRVALWVSVAGGE